MSALTDIEPLNRQTLGDRSYFQLAEMLISGQLAPGERLSLRSAAEVLGVSIMPVREAVSRLVADKALEVMPNRAVRVPVLSVSQFRDLTRVRVMVEGHAAAEAAVNRSDDDLKQIALAEAPLRKLSMRARPTMMNAVAYNKSFHFAVYEAAHSPSLNEIIRALWLKTGPVLNLDLRANPGRLKTGGAIQHHADVLAAIRDGDAASARAGIAADISDAAEFIISRGGLAE